MSFDHHSENAILVERQLVINILLATNNLPSTKYLSMQHQTLHSLQLLIEFLTAFLDRYQQKKSLLCSSLTIENYFSPVFECLLCCTLSSAKYVDLILFLGLENKVHKYLGKYFERKINVKCLQFCKLQVSKLSIMLT